MRSFDYKIWSLEMGNVEYDISNIKFECGICIVPSVKCGV